MFDSFLCVRPRLISGLIILATLTFLPDFTPLIGQELNAAVDKPLAPVKTESPRATMKTFYEAMKLYRSGVELGDSDKEAAIDRAIQTLDMSELTVVLQEQKGREAAIFLKEVIDRIIVLDYQKIPDADNKQEFWRLKDTEIAIRIVAEGPRRGEYLFTTQTVARAKKFYERVKKYPYIEGGGKGAFYRSSWESYDFPAWLNRTFMGMFVWQWVGVLLSVLLGGVFRFLAVFILRVLRKIASKTRGHWDDSLLKLIEKPFGLVMATGAWYMCGLILKLDGSALTIYTWILQVTISIALVWMAYQMSGLVSEFVGHWAERTQIPLDSQMLPMINKAIGLFIIVLGTLIAIQNLGINVMSLLAGLGLGGLAFALAFKDTAANLLGSVVILWDQPFRVGDWIVTPETEGTVEEIGFRSTRIRTFYNSVASVPNSVMANAAVDNMGLRQRRRIRAVLALTYDTPPDTLEGFIEGVKQIILASPDTWKESFHVVFTGYGASSLDILVYCFLETPDWGRELVARQRIYIEILRLAEAMGVSFAFPTTSVHLESTPDKSAPSEQITGDKAKIKSLADAFGVNGKDAKPDGLGIFVPPYETN